MRNPCRTCLHFRSCLERRGRCSEFTDVREVRKDIERINQTYRAEAANAEQGVQEAPLAGDGDGQIHNSASVQL